MRFGPGYNQADWYSRRRYADHTYWGTFAPELWVLHYGGGRYPYDAASWVETAALLKRWQDFHIDTRGWSDLAYNYSGDPESGRPVRLRGENANGANSGSSYWGNRTRTFVFTVNNDEVPAPPQRRAFARMWVEDPLPVTGHGLLPPTPGGVVQSTSCPGDWLKEWIAREGWIEDLKVWSVGDKGRTVRSVRRRLSDLGYKVNRYRKRYTEGMKGAVQAFQRENAIDDDGIIGPDTFRALSVAKPRPTPLRWWRTRNFTRMGPL